MTEVALALKNTVYSSPTGFGEWLGNGRYGRTCRRRESKQRELSEFSGGKEVHNWSAGRRR